MKQQEPSSFQKILDDYLQKEGKPLPPDQLPKADESLEEWQNRVNAIRAALGLPPIPPEK